MKQRIWAAENDSVSDREKENREISYRAACEGIVLLKNNGILPVRPGRIALYGAGVSHTVKGGTGSGEVNERHVVSILEGMENAGFEITTKEWLDSYNAELKRKYDAWKKGSKIEPDIINHMKEPFLAPSGRLITDEDIRQSSCDTAIYVVSRQAGEGADKKLEKGEFNLHPVEIASIEKMVAGYMHSILVINSGSYMDIGNLDEKVSAVIYFCQQGMEGGRAFADIICGKVNPSGKLSDTWANQYADIPFGMSYSYLSGDTSYEEYKEGIYVGYRYFDTFKVKPRYHFGYGLSYTDFKISEFQTNYDCETVVVKACVKNSGKLAGKEILQIYVSCPDGEVEKEEKRLVGFAKTTLLKPQEEQTLEISFSLDYLASYCEEDASFILEKGDYVLRGGNSSDNTIPFAVIELDERAVVSKLTNVCQPYKALTEAKAPQRMDRENYFGLQRIKLSSKEIKAKVAEYRTPDSFTDDRVNKVLEELNVRDMVEICVGEGMPIMFSTAGNFVPGAVGRTTSRLRDKGIPNISLSDGPAGLRLLKVSALNKKGIIKFQKGNYMIDVLNDMPDFILGWFEMKDKDRKLYQFTSSFPVETALAQSWNTGLCKEVGLAISREMKEYGVTFWLAPALNIHKNPLCGRNFEYMSEDPVLSGKIASALTRGIQSTEGCYATIKHFACNNVEDNRNKSDSRLDERTLREIYLRAFEICVKEAHPKSVMTSYNMLNGVYTPNSYDLCTKVLRNEWGFDGVVMTDWFSTLPGLAKADLAIKAGNDMLMPGLKSDKLRILAAIKKGNLSLEELKRAAYNILKSIIESGMQ
jgi:Beta-glucosidase-related glycosidases